MRSRDRRKAGQRKVRDASVREEFDEPDVIVILSDLSLIQVGLDEIEDCGHVCEEEGRKEDISTETRDGNEIEQDPHLHRSRRR